MRPASPFTLHDMDRQQGAEDERDHQNRVSSSVQIGSSVCRVADGQPVRGRIPQPVGGGNCTMPLLLENFAINGKGSVIRLPDNKNETYPALRTPCNGYVPVANGLLYAVGSGCGCVPLFVRGMAAHGAARIVDTEAFAGRPRPVERGPGRPSKENATGWTMYRADLRRSAATAATIGGVPKISWTARLDGRTRRRHLCCRWPLPTTWCSPPANTAWRRSRRMLNLGSRRDWESWPSRGAPHAVAMAGDVVVAAQGQPDGTGKLTVCSRADGAAVASLPLPAPPVRAGLAVVEGAIVAVCADGSVVMTRSP